MKPQCPQRRSTWLRSGALALLAGSTLMALGQRSRAQGDDDPVASSRTVLEQWVETERLLSKEKRDWVLGRESLNERIGLVEREISSFQERIEEAKGSIAEADKKREELMAENERLKEATSSLVDTIAGLEGRVRALLPRLPEPIQDKVKLLSQRLRGGRRVQGLAQRAVPERGRDPEPGEQVPP